MASLELDEPAHATCGPRISTESSRISAWVIPTNEELTIARHTQRLLGACKEGSYDVALDTAASIEG